MLLFSFGLPNSSFVLFCFFLSNAFFKVSGKPSDFLKQVIGRSVVVKLNSGVEYHGKKKK